MTSAREICKNIAYAIATAAVLPAVCSFYIRGSIIGRDRALEGSSQLLALIPGLLGQCLRRAFLARALARCDRTATIEYGTLFSAVGTSIGARVYIGPNCLIGLVHFEDNALVAPAVQIPSGRLTHGVSDPVKAIRDQEGQREMVRIGRGAWIGGAAIVMADVGRDSIVGAGAVVTHPVPDRVVVGGVPARVLRRRDESSEPVPLAVRSM